MRPLTNSLAALGLLAAAAAPALAQDGGRPFDITLSGAAEVPGPGDADGRGSAALKLNAGQGEVCYDLTAADITLPATGAHIHRGASTEAGPVAVALKPPGGDGKSSGCANVSKTLAQEMLKSPEQFYVNVHTTDHPAGAVRGQLATSAAK